MDFNQLIQEYGHKVYSLALRMTGNEFDAEDVTQETFLRVHRSLDTFRGGSSIYSWIYRITLNTALRMKGRLDKTFFDSLDEAAEVYGSEVPDDIQRWGRLPEERFLYDSLLREIQRACVHFVTRSLTDEQRVVYVLRGMLGFSLDEISNILDIDKNVVKARLHRAKKSMKKYFSGRCQWSSDSGGCSCESKLGFALTAAPDIIKKLQKYPTDSDMERVISATLTDVTDLDQVRRFYPDEPAKVELMEKLLSSVE